MFRVPATGGVPAEIARSEEARTAGYTFNWPSFLPDGRHILVTAWHADPAKRQIQVRTLDDATAVTVLNVGSNAFYAPPGYLLYQRDGTLMAQAFDANRLVTSGEAVRISDVPISRTTGRGAILSLGQWRARVSCRRVLRSHFDAHVVQTGRAECSARWVIRDHTTRSGSLRTAHA